MTEQSANLREQEFERQIVIPENATHRDILQDTLKSLRAQRAVIITGDSRAGKSTFLKHTLGDTLSTNNLNSSFQNCMAELPENVVEALGTFEGVVVLDEAFRLSHDQRYVEALRERIANHRPIVICNTRFGKDSRADEALQRFVNAIGADEETVTKVDFPSEVNDDDARRVIQGRLSLIKDKFNNYGRLVRVDLAAFSKKLAELTRNPKLLADIADQAVRTGALENPDVDVYGFVRSLLDQDKLYFEDSLKDEREKMRQELNSQDEVSER